jgi:predicted regulator of Ras-like GTPase activity (Roadblock/LC7/MglB family)
VGGPEAGGTLSAVLLGGIRRSEEVRVKEEVQAAFEEMMDISTDIDKAVVFSKAGILASNMGEQAQKAAVRQAQELIRLAEARAAEAGSQAFTQLSVDTGSGYVFVSRELGSEGLTVLATGKKGSRVGLALYDLKTCLRDAGGASAAQVAKGRRKKGE